MIISRSDFIEVADYLTRLELFRVGPGRQSLTPEGRRYVNAADVPDLRDRISRRSG